MTLTPTRPAPVDNLVRSFSAPAELRATDGAAGDGRTLYGHFAKFDAPTMIESSWEGRFVETIAPGAFAKSLAEDRDRIKIMFDHGRDPGMGSRPLGRILELREDKQGAYYEVSLLRTPFNDDYLIPALREGILGASFRFSIVDERWTEPKSATKRNPERLPERTILEAKVYEAGPVSMPAYLDATAMLRSGTDDYMESFLNDPLFVARFAERAGLRNTERLIIAAAQPEPDEEADLLAELSRVRRQKQRSLLTYARATEAPAEDESDPVSADGDTPTDDEDGGAPTAAVTPDPPDDGEPGTSTTPDAPLDEEPGSGDRAAHGPTEPRTFTFAERQHHARLILARQAGLGGTR